MVSAVRQRLGKAAVRRSWDMVGLKRAALGYSVAEQIVGVARVVDAAAWVRAGPVAVVGPVMRRQDCNIPGPPFCSFSGLVCKGGRESGGDPVANFWRCC